MPFSYKIIIVRPAGCMDLGGQTVQQWVGQWFHSPSPARTVAMQHCGCPSKYWRIHAFDHPTTYSLLVHAMRKTWLFVRVALSHLYMLMHVCAQKRRETFLSNHGSLVSVQAILIKLQACQQKLAGSILPQDSVSSVSVSGGWRVK